MSLLATCRPNPSTLTNYFNKSTLKFHGADVVQLHHFFLGTIQPATPPGALPLSGEKGDKRTFHLRIIPPIAKVLRMRLFQKHEGKKGALFRLRLKTGFLVQTYRTLCFAPTAEMKAVFNDLRGFGLAT